MIPEALLKQIEEDSIFDGEDDFFKINLEDLKKILENWFKETPY